MLLGISLCLILLVGSFAVALWVGPKLKAEGEAWLTFVYHNEIHTIPKNDSIAHSLVECQCAPLRDPWRKVNGDWLYRVVHIAQDGRKQCK